MDLEEQFGVAEMTRLRDLRIGPGRGELPQQRPTLAYLPGLRSMPWWDASTPLIAPVTSWMEEHFGAILEEANASTRPESKDVEAYPHLTLEGELADGWDVVFLCKSGARKPDVIAKHPTMAAMLEQFPRLGVFEFFVSRLAPGTHLVPHCGTNNLVLTIHLPLITPDGDCAISVAGDSRRWETGRTIAFDDSFEHEAWNRTDEDRVALLASFVHPDLTDVECAAISHVMPVFSALYEEMLASEQA